MDPLLHGHDAEERIVALHPLGEGSVRLYNRIGDELSSRDESFFPFFFLSDRNLLEGFAAGYWLKELKGNSFFRFVCAFETWHGLWDAIHHIFDAHNKKSLEKAETYASLDSVYLPQDPLSQYLLQTGKTLFKGMRFEELHRLQLDIETYSATPGQFSRPDRPGDKIIMIALSDNQGWEQLLDAGSRSEEEMILESVRLIRERDPDIIEGHNIYEFDLPYIMRRCEFLGISFSIGRDASSPMPPPGLVRQPGNQMRFPLTEVAGRQIIDTYLLVRSYDQGKRSMESYGLKYAAKFFGIAPDDRTYIQGDKIAWHWDHDPEPLRRYALDDVRETRGISDHLSRTFFYLAQMLPMTYSGILRSGSAQKIENLLLREYLRERHSVPSPSGGFQTTGGYTDIFAVGILGPIVHADIESLYPSIMISKGIAPGTDVLKAFPSLLEELTKLRLQSKRSMQRAGNETERSRFDSLQSSLKILINSFYGYLGYSRALFNDFSQADAVTIEGQRLLRLMITNIRSSGGTVIEVDTDGIFFVPPPETIGEEAEARFVASISDQMPQGITVALDGRYRKMVSYKKKNYALLEYDGNLKIKGSSLTSRSIERFGREYIRSCISKLLEEDFDGLHETYCRMREKIQSRGLSFRDFARVETLAETLTDYRKSIESGKRSRSAAYEVASRMDKRFRRGDRIAYYLTGDDPTPKGFECAKSVNEWDPHFPDENIPYYLRRLDEISEKFHPFFSPTDYRRIFSPDDLFPFSASGIAILEPEIREQDHGDPIHAPDAGS